MNKLNLLILITFISLINIGRAQQSECGGVSQVYEEENNESGVAINLSYICKNNLGSFACIYIGNTSKQVVITGEIKGDFISSSELYNRSIKSSQSKVKISLSNGISLKMRKVYFELDKSTGNASITYSKRDLDPLNGFSSTKDSALISCK